MNLQDHYLMRSIPFVGSSLYSPVQARARAPHINSHTEAHCVNLLQTHVSPAPELGTGSRHHKSLSAVIHPGDCSAL